METDRDDLQNIVDYSDQAIEDAISVIVEGIPAKTYLPTPFLMHPWRFFLGKGKHQLHRDQFVEIPDVGEESANLRWTLCSDPEYIDPLPAKLLFQWATSGFLKHGYKDYHNSYAIGLVATPRLRFIVRYGFDVVSYDVSLCAHDQTVFIQYMKRLNAFMSEDVFFDLFKNALPKKPKPTNVVKFKRVLASNFK